MYKIKLNKLKLISYIIVFSIFSSFNHSVIANEETEKSIELRQLAMQGMWLRVKRIAPYIETDSPIEYGPSDVERDVNELVELLDKVENLWPKTSNLSNYGRTNANPSVWAIPDYFSKLYSRAQNSAKDLQLSLSQGNDILARASICELGKSCGSCHASFRRLLTSELAEEASAWSGRYDKECE